MTAILYFFLATYCSCGDSINPGKLSGPNLFTLLSKLGIICNLSCLFKYFFSFYYYLYFIYLLIYFF
jgi:hypothetical protein